MEKERTIKKYGKWYRITEQPKYKPNKRKFTRKPADNDKPKERSNYGTSMLKAYAIALNNSWQWYGTLQLSNEPVPDFATAYDYINSLIARLRKIRERSETKSLAYLIVPDFVEEQEMQQWFIHIWLLDFPDTEKAFLKDNVKNKKIVYHWKKYEKQNGKTELYRIYDSDYITNGEYKDTVARQIYDIIKRTAKQIPKEKSVYYCSDNITRDILIARGDPTSVPILSTAFSNEFVKSKWITGNDEAKNLEEAKQYVVTFTEEDHQRAIERHRNEDPSEFLYFAAHGKLKKQAKPKATIPEPQEAIPNICYDEPPEDFYNNIGYEENYDYTDVDFLCSPADFDFVPSSADYDELNLLFNYEMR